MVFICFFITIVLLVFARGIDRLGLLWLGLNIERLLLWLLLVLLLVLRLLLLLRSWMRRLGTVHLAIGAILRVDDLRWAKDLDRSVILAHGNLVLALGAVVLGVFEPVEEAGQTCEADANEAKDGANDTKRGRKKLAFNESQRDSGKLVAYICMEPPSRRTTVWVRL